MQQHSPPLNQNHLNGQGRLFTSSVLLVGLIVAMNNDCGMQFWRREVPESRRHHDSRFAFVGSPDISISATRNEGLLRGLGVCRTRSWPEESN